MSFRLVCVVHLIGLASHRAEIIAIAYACNLQALGGHVVLRFKIIR